MRSNKDLEVKAVISQQFQMAAESNAEPQEPDKKGDWKEVDNAANMASVAVNVGIFNNTAKATVSPDAELDALRTTRVISDVTYPFLSRFDQYIPLSLGELEDAIRNEGSGAVTKYISNSFGARDAFFNTWVASTDTAGKLGFEASVSVLVLTNHSEAVVKTGAKINQDASWRDYGNNLHPNQHPNYDDDETGPKLGAQVVSIEATNYQQSVNMTGIFKLPDLPSPDAILDKLPGMKEKQNEERKDISRTGSGVGGSIYVNAQENRTHAIVEDGAFIFSGGHGGFNIKAEEAQLIVNLAQAWASGGESAVGGTVIYNGHTADTVARLGKFAVVTGRDARVYAGSLATNISWAGGIASGESVGVGISVAINNINRTTLALIGDEQVNADALLREDSTIKVAEGVEVLALVPKTLSSFRFSDCR